MKRHAHLFEFLATDGALAAQDAIFRARVYTALSAYASTLADWNWCLELRKQSAAFWREAGEESEALLADAMVAYAENYLGASLARDTVPALYAIVERLNAIGAAASYAARIEYNLASMELALGHVEKALQLALSAVAVMRREHRTNYIAACLTTLTRVYIQQNEFALAQRCVDESLALTEDPSYAVLRAQALGDGARIMLATNKPQEALRTYALALQTYERAFELRFVIRTLLGTLDALLDLGFAKRAAQISGYILGACAATGSVANAAIFEASSTYQRTREQAGDEFDGCARLGATFTYADVVKDVCAAASREDDFRTIASL
jgi:hypothetical protein